MGRKEMDDVGFAVELFGIVPVFLSKMIYKNISDYPEVKKNIIVDLLRANPKKYVPVFLGNDE
jgi:hypothetical protein